MAASTCTAVKPGRCTPPGQPRATTHVCTRFPGHAVAWHRCACGHAWPHHQPDNHTPPTHRRGARRRAS